MQLATLLQAANKSPIPFNVKDWTAAVQQCNIEHLAIDSRHVQTNTLFFALQGSGDALRTAGFIRTAIAQGAVVVLTDVDFSQAITDTGAGDFAVPVLFAPQVSQHIGDIAAAFFNDLNAQQALPRQALKIAAVTGTNGKTTISRLLAELLHINNHPTAVMGTTGNGILPNLVPSTHTTLDALNLQAALYQFAQQGATFAALEASSHGLDQGRLTGVPISVAIFSNLTRDHLDYHGTVDAYAVAKAALFTFPQLTHAIVNADDPYGAVMLADVAAQVTQWRYSVQDINADFYAYQIEPSLSGATMQVRTPAGEMTLHSPLLGKFNVSNLLAAVAGAMALGLNLAQIAAAVPQLVGAAGRMQVIRAKERLFVVDYAHTPDALTQVLASLRPHVAGQLRCVFGCGGNRDTGKRPLMTQAALQGADWVLVTADNPRSEAVSQIINDMLVGVSDAQHAQLSVEEDRRQAIRHAVASSQAGDIVVIAGKGHEDYQEILGVRHWFDDVAEIKSALIGLNCAVSDVLSV